MRSLLLLSHKELLVAYNKKRRSWLKISRLSKTRSATSQLSRAEEQNWLVYLNHSLSVSTLPGIRLPSTRNMIIAQHALNHLLESLKIQRLRNTRIKSKKSTQHLTSLIVKSQKLKQELMQYLLSRTQLPMYRIRSLTSTAKSSASKPLSVRYRLKQKNRLIQKTVWLALNQPSRTLPKKLYRRQKVKVSSKRTRIILKPVPRYSRILESRLEL